jgi:hypothetical protein
MNLKGKLIIKESNNELERRTLASSQVEIKKIFQKAKVKIHAEIINLVVEALSSCPEIQSLRSGKLRSDFGLPNDVTEEIVYSIANSTYVYFRDFQFTKATVENLLSVYIQPSDFKNLLNSDFAMVETDKGELLPWLKWLLLEGDSIIINQYHVSYGTYPTSRTGEAIMLPGSVFKVDSQFSGTAEDNFITRALDRYEDRISEIVRTSL